MSSSMLTGERRWASARRGGMTVLGKVAVPKPINLPSQRLENHGLDPNVEIVPKHGRGTHSWGGRSSTSNAWGSSTLSPNTDGGTGSPSHPSGRPSSGGTGTRPSTAGSDRADEPITTAWGSNSRPSSASGALASSQTSHASLRPRSAETRPGSSQLSRFAEPFPDNTVAWGASGTAEKLGVASTKNDGFSLASGDFPTLGSEKENSTKHMDSQDHDSRSRPGSSSGGVIQGKESTGNSVGDISGNANLDSGAPNSWRRENLTYGEDGVRPGVEKWHADPQLYPNSSIPPQHYDAWHGPPVNNHPGGVWYRGPSGGPPFGSPIPPGGFPMEPFPYYRPQIPPAALANPPPVHPPGAGPRGPHPKNGDMYRPPHMHEAYIRPGMPLRPGFYPGPIPYEGYYGPPMGYCNSNERDIPFMGMAVGRAPHNRYANQNAPDTSNSHGRSGVYGPNAKTMVLERVESGNPQDARGPYKVLLKQHDGWEGRNEAPKWDDTVTTNASYPGRGEHPKSSWENDWREENGNDKEKDPRKMGFCEEGSSAAIGSQGVFPVKVKSFESVGNLKASDSSSVKKLEYADPVAPNFSEASIALKDPSLIQKIEGLNAKARASDGRQDVKCARSREEDNSKLNACNPKSNQSANAAGSDAASVERIHVSGIMGSHKDHVSAVDESLESALSSGMATSRRPMHAMHGRADNRGKGRFSNQDVEGWQKRSQVEDLPSGDASLCFESPSVTTFTDVTEKAGSYPQGKDERESGPPNSDANDTQAERAKMKELAIQRLKQREKEEEERTRDQKAKARAKLEELNRRTQAGESSNQQPEIIPSSDVQNTHEEISAMVKPIGAASKSRATSSVLGSNASAVAASGIGQIQKPDGLSSDVLQEAPKTAHKESVVVHDQSEQLQHDVSKADAPHHNNALPIHDTVASGQKRMGYREKQNSLLEKNSNEKLISSTTDALNSAVTSDVAASSTLSLEGVSNEIASNSDSNFPANQSVIAESSVPHRKKNRIGKNKHKVEESSSALALPSRVSKDATALDDVVEGSKGKIPDPALDPTSVKPLTDSKDSTQSLEQCTSTPGEENHTRINNQQKSQHSLEHCTSTPGEENHTRINNQRKSQHSRRMQRNPQANKSTEKFHIADAVVWAPVRSQNKTEVANEATEKLVVEVAALSTRSDQQVQNNLRNKRAEMERYVPKPVAKEMAQLGTSHQSIAPLMSRIASDESVGGPEFSPLDAESSQTSDSGMGKMASAVESRNGDGRQNKLGKGHGSWRQRTPSESTFTSNPSRHAPKSIEHHPRKPDLSTVKEQSSGSDEWGTSDGWHIPEKTDTPVGASVVKDHGVTSKGKRQLYRGHKGAGHTRDPDEKRDNTVDPVHSSSSEICQADWAVGERSTTHWQPKSQPFPGSNQRGSRTNGGQKAGAEIDRSNKRDSTSQGQPVGETPVFRDQPEKGNFEEAPSVGHQDSKRERKMVPQKGRLGSPAEPSSNTDFRNEQRPSSAFRKNGSQNSRFGRQHESHGDWSGSGKDNKQHTVPANRERQKQTAHYEYQPVGAVPHNNNRANNFESLKEGSHSSSARYKDKVQGHSRHGGNFYGRQSGSAPVEASYK